MTLETILQRIRDAFDQLSRRDLGPAADAPAPRPRAPPHRPETALLHAPQLAKEGFVEEALPWMDAVHRFALRLTRGDAERGADLVQETFMRAYRAWDSYDRGTNCRSWLFTICKNAYLHDAELASRRREIPERVLDVEIDALGHEEVHDYALHYGGGADIFDRILDDRLVDAIDALPDEYRDVLVLSDLGDLRYGEIAEVLEIPVGTVKSRLFRARRMLQKSLIDYAADAGLVQDASA